MKRISVQLLLFTSTMVVLMGCTSPDRGIAQIDINLDNNIVISQNEISSVNYNNNMGIISLGKEITYSGENMSVDGNVVNITGSGDYTIIGTLEDGMININTTEKVNLRLDGVKITNLNGPAIYIENAEQTLITLIEGTTNYLEDGNNYIEDIDIKGVLFSNNNLEINGNGTLNIIGNYEHGIASNGNIVIESGKIIITSVGDGIHAYNDLIINGGSVSISSGNDGLHANNNLIINGGSIDIIESVEGIESKSALVINNGYITVVSSDDGINASDSITINGGQLHIDAQGDGIDSNGTLDINGGTVIVAGSTNMNDGALDADDEFHVNGGILVALGNGMMVLPSLDSEQNTLFVNYDSTQVANTLIGMRYNDDDILVFSPTKDYRYIIFSSDNVLEDVPYSVYSGGSVEGNSVNGLYIDSIYIPGTFVKTITTKDVPVSNDRGPGGRGGVLGGPRPGR